MRACRREPVDCVPVWLMRQAGRYMPEYRQIRGSGSFLEFCKQPKLCAEVMLIAVEKLRVDAAILFTDLLVLLEPLGLQVVFAADGPMIANPIRKPEDLKKLRPLRGVGTVEYVLEAVRLTRAGLPDPLPLIGFAGAPFTLASYAVEGSGKRSYTQTKRFMYSHPQAWHVLMELLTEAVCEFLRAQIEAGACAVQLFDSWVGCLGPEDYRQFVLPYSRRCFEAIPPQVPAIHFATGNPALLPLMAEAGGSVIGLDWRIGLAEAWEILGPHKALQGNLDPAVLLAPPAVIQGKVAEILLQCRGRRGYIFNLGHGVLPETPVENVQQLVAWVHELSANQS